MTAPFANWRVGLVGPMPPPPGGMAMQTQQLATLLRAVGADVNVVPTNAPYRPSWIGRIRLVRSFARLLPYALSLWRLAGRSDVMHVMANSGWSWHLFAAPAIWISTLRRTPAIVNYRGGGAGEFLQHQGALVRWSMRRAAALVVPSGFLQEVFAQHGMESTVIPNVVDTNCFVAAKGGRRSVQLLVTRAFEPIYDIETAVRAFARLHALVPQLTLAIAGSGPTQNGVRALAKELGVSERVHFLGRLDRQAVAQALRESAVLVNPSLVDNMPNSLLEAMASGVPIVSTNVGGVPHIVRDEESALLVQPGDATAMAQAILRILQDPTLAQKLASAGLSESRKYTWPQIMPLLARAYQRALNEGGPQRLCTRD